MSGFFSFSIQIEPTNSTILTKLQPFIITISQLFL
jgi:hypothetical protein